MRELRRGFMTVLIAAAAMFAFAQGSASAADTITADLSCCTFAPGPYGQDLGEIPTFDNPVGADAPHNVTSTVRGPDGAPLFRSRTIGAGSTSPVAGTQYLAGGTYPFYCTLHGLSMGGELLVSADVGTIVPRPAIRVSIPSQSLRAIRKSGTVKVSVKALSGSPRVNLSVKSGAKTVASASRIAINSGATRTIRVKLTRAGSKALSKGRKAVISVKGSVAFGSPVSAKRTVR